ncbi:nucleoside phosphorylase [Streptomyces sp. NPDC001617]
MTRLNGTPQPTTLPVTRIPATGLPAHALVVGDPARAARICELLKDAEKIGENREYLTFQGDWKGRRVVVASHGVGGPGAVCCFQELMDAGVRTVVRLGTAGAMTAALKAGDLLVAEAAIREDGVSDQYLPLSYPAYCTPEVVLALSASAKAHGRDVHRSPVWTRALLYPGRVPFATEAYAASGVAAIEMELSALLVLAASRGCRSGGLFVIDGVSADEQPYDPHTVAVADAIELAAVVALDALVAL